MKKILIADASKASLVMTSEVFKDHFPGVHVLVARTSSEALEIAKNETQIDAFVVDFDLPDKDGAYTAAKIKKLFPIPVLITAFDRPDVQETIEKLCSAYDDCLSWLAKPVNSELVVSIAQRFIEGNYRTQRRIDCVIPGVAELLIRSRPASKKSKSADSDSAAATTETRICVPVMLEDCSVGGFKFRVMKKDLQANSVFQFSNDGRLNIHETITIYVPSFENIQTGEENVGYWLWDEKRDSGASGPGSEKRNSGAKSTSLSAIKRTARQNLGSKSHEGQSIKGQSIWTTRVDGGDVLIGVRSDNMTLSKRLFESVLLGDNKIQARKAQQETQRERQRELAAARVNTPPRPQLEIITGSFVKNLPTESASPTVSQKAQPQILAKTAQTGLSVPSEPAKVIPINRPKTVTAKKAPEKTKSAKAANGASAISKAKPKVASKAAQSAPTSKSKPAAELKKNQKLKPKAAAGKPALKSKPAAESKVVAGKKVVVKGKSNIPKAGTKTAAKAKSKTKPLQSKKPKVTAKSKKNSRRSVRAS
jgi:CheY-like chemotaxis protein